MTNWLDEYSAPHFPATNLAQEEPNGLLAAGGLLTPQWLISAYRKGIFLGSMMKALFFGGAQRRAWFYCRKTFTLAAACAN